MLTAIYSLRSDSDFVVFDRDMAMKPLATADWDDFDVIAVIEHEGKIENDPGAEAHGLADHRLYLDSGGNLEAWTAQQVLFGDAGEAVKVHFIETA